MQTRFHIIPSYTALVHKTIPSTSPSPSPAPPQCRHRARCCVRTRHCEALPDCQAPHVACNRVYAYRVCPRSFFLFVSAEHGSFILFIIVVVIQSNPRKNLCRFNAFSPKRVWRIKANKTKYTKYLPRNEETVQPLFST